MLFKKYSYLLLAGLLSTAIVSCDDEDDTVQILDEENPTATFTSPTAAQLEAGFEPGASFMLQGTVTDNRDLKTVMVTATAPGATSPWYTKTWNDDQFDESLTINETIAIPAEAMDGMHVLMLTAMDDADNTLTQTWNVNVMAAGQQDMVTYTLTVPEAVTEDIYIAGEFMNEDGTAATWNEPGTNAEMMLTRVDDLTYTITLPVMDATGPDGTPDNMIEYKYVLGSGWDNEEVALADCVSSNRSMELPLATMEANDTVEAWKATCGQ